MAMTARLQGLPVSMAHPALSCRCSMGVVWVPQSLAVPAAAAQGNRGRAGNQTASGWAELSNAQRGGLYRAASPAGRGLVTHCGCLSFCTSTDPGPRLALAGHVREGGQPLPWSEK